MDKKDLIFSTVALSAVMLTSSFGFTPEVKAEETGFENVDTSYDDESEDDYFSENVYVNEDGMLCVGERKEDKLVVNSYKEKITIFKGNSVSVNDLKIHCSTTEASVVFSNGKVSTDVYNDTGTFNLNYSRNTSNNC